MKTKLTFQWLLCSCFLAISLQLQAQTQLGNTLTGNPGDNSGYAVALNDAGTVMAVGAPYEDTTFDQAGKVQVYELINGNWQNLGNPIYGESLGAALGSSVALNAQGNLLVVGSPNYYGSNGLTGRVSVYALSGNYWNKVGNSFEGEAQSLFGTVVSIDDAGTTIAIGAPHYGANNSLLGQVKVFEYINFNWVSSGNTITGANSNDQLGRSLSLNGDGTILAIGVPNFDANTGGADHGQVQIREKSAMGDWLPRGNFIGGANAGDRFGSDVAMSGSGNRLIIGAPFRDGASSNTGEVQVYEFSSNSWAQLGNSIQGNDSGANFGLAVAMSKDGKRIALGAERNNSAGNNAGKVNVYKIFNGDWTMVDNTINGDSAEDHTGWDVGLNEDGTVLTVGSFQGNGTNNNAAGFVKAYSLSPGDTQAPNVSCQSTTIYLDENGEAVLEAIEIDNGSTDNVNIYTYEVDFTNFDCSDIGEQEVTLTVTDGEENSAACTTTIMVTDQTPPSFTCLPDLSINLSAPGATYTLPDFITTNQLLLEDNCTVSPSIAQDPSPGTELVEGEHTVVITATDAANNMEECTFTVSVDSNLSTATKALQEIELATNPVKNYLHLKNEQHLPLQELVIYDLSGKEVLQFNLQEHTSHQPLAVASLQAGQYVVKITAQSKATLIKRLIKE